MLEVFEAIERRDNKRHLELCLPDVGVLLARNPPVWRAVQWSNRGGSGWAEIWIPLQPTEAERSMDPRVVAARDSEAAYAGRLDPPWLGHANQSITDAYSKLHEDVAFRKKVAEQVEIGFELPVEKLEAPANAHRIGAGRRRVRQRKQSHLHSTTTRGAERDPGQARQENLAHPWSPRRNAASVSATTLPALILIESLFSSVKRKLSARTPGRSMRTQKRQALLLGLSFNLYHLKHRRPFLRMSTERTRLIMFRVQRFVPPPRCSGAKSDATQFLRTGLTCAAPAALLLLVE